MRMKLSTIDWPTACRFSPIAFRRLSLITTTGNGTCAREFAAESVGARGRLLGAADDRCLGAALDDAGREVGAVVEKDVRCGVEDRARCCSRALSSVSSRVPKTVMPASRRAATVSSWVEPKLPVAMISAPPAARVSSSTAVFGSRWRDMPMRCPANGCVAVKSLASLREERHAGTDPVDARAALCGEVRVDVCVDHVSIVSYMEVNFI